MLYIFKIFVSNFANTFVITRASRFELVIQNLFFLIFHIKCVMGIQKNQLIDTVLLSTPYKLKNCWLGCKQSIQTNK